MRDEFLETVDLLSEKLEQIYTQSEIMDEHIWNLSGRNSILRKVIDFVSNANQQILLSVWDEELEEIGSCLKKQTGVM